MSNLVPGVVLLGTHKETGVVEEFHCEKHDYKNYAPYEEDEGVDVVCVTRRLDGWGEDGRMVYEYGATLRKFQAYVDRPEGWPMKHGYGEYNYAIKES